MTFSALQQLLLAMLQAGGKRCRSVKLRSLYAGQDGGGWCAYSDIYLAIRQLRRASGGRVQRFMIVDLDVHQVS